VAAILFVAALPARAGQEADSTLKWQPRAASAAPKAVLTVAHTESQQPAAPIVNRAVLQWTNSRKSYQPPGAKPRGSILQLNSYEEAQTPAANAGQAADPSADKNPFDVAQQPEKKDGGEPTGELPAPDTSPPPAAALPIPDDAEPAPKPFNETKAEPAPEAAAPAAEPLEKTAPAAEPAPPSADELFKDQPIPKPSESELPIPSGDLSEGILTKPGQPGCKGYDKQCRDALRQLQERDITTVVVGVIIEGTEGEDFPCDCKVGRDFQLPQFVARNFTPTIFTWKASGICHKPLYFEDVQLERYGHSWNPIVQPFVSGAHFFVSVPLLPYKMGLRPPHECVYTLGYYRPGSCAPYMFEPIPLSLRAAAFEAAGATAFAFWFWPPN
jgi:hypothetical protein